MKTKKSDGSYLCCAYSCTFCFLSRFSKELTKSESPKQLTEKADQAVEAGNYSPTSAIARAKGVSESKSLRDEAYQLFGINIRSHQKDVYLQFRERLFANAQLKLALQNAKKEGVSVFLGNEFEVQTHIVIYGSAVDDEIVEFLNKSVPVAKAKKAGLEILKNEASQYGLTIFFLRDGEYYKQIRSLLIENRFLVSALQMAEKAGLTVYPSSKFEIQSNYLEININATDEEIIKFLLGE